MEEKLVFPDKGTMRAAVRDLIGNNHVAKHSLTSKK